MVSDCRVLKIISDIVPSSHGHFICQYLTHPNALSRSFAHLEHVCPAMSRAFVSMRVRNATCERETCRLQIIVARTDVIARRGSADPLL